MHSDFTEVTRYLSAACYHDSSFRRKVLEESIENRYNFIGTSLGVHIDEVAAHALLANKRLKMKELLVFVLSIPAVFFLPLFIIPLGVVIYYRWWIRYRVITRKFMRHNYQPGQFSQQMSALEVKQLERLQALEDSNVVVYSSFKPFIGSGVNIGGWNIVINTEKGKKQFETTLTPEPFETREIDEWVAASMRSLGLEEKLNISEKLYVHGTDIRDDKRFLPNILARPKSHIDQTLFDEICEAALDDIRNYRSFSIVKWDGQLVLNVFLKFAKISNHLGVEVAYFLLTPLKKSFTEIDQYNANPSWRQISQFFMGSLVMSPFNLIGDIFSVLGRFSFGQEKQKRQEVRDNPGYNYGAEESIREHAASEKYEYFFQLIDKELYVKLIEKRLLQSIIEFLEEKNIDTSDLVEQKTTILNNGVIMSGGSISGDNVAIGEKAKAAISNVIPNAVKK